jgi:hypothetical protein
MMGIKSEQETRQSGQTWSKCIAWKIYFSTVNLMSCLRRAEHICSLSSGQYSTASSQAARVTRMDGPLCAPPVQATGRWEGGAAAALQGRPISMLF